jgi:hypothetical protein
MEAKCSHSTPHNDLRIWISRTLQVDTFVAVAAVVATTTCVEL